MIVEAIKEIILNLDGILEESELGEPFFGSHNYKAHSFNKEYFKPICLVKSDRKLAFVDGGNLELLSAPNFSIHLNRIYFNIFEGRTRIRNLNIPQMIEFFSVTFAVFENNEIFFKTRIFAIEKGFFSLMPLGKDLSFSSMDRKLMDGSSRADITRVASIARRFAEWKFSRYIVENELEKGDILVMDGTLRTAFRNETSYAEQAYNAAKRKGVIYSGLSKTSKRLFTTTGLSLLGALRKFAEDSEAAPMWYYYPIADSLSPEHEAAFFIVKLHEHAQRIFRYEIYGGQAKALPSEEINELICQLSINSSDVSFPGYPYGLIDADTNARVKYDELETYRIMLISEASRLGSWSKFLRHMQSVDAHSILNTLRG
jgi:hypothetical protein